MSADFQIYTSRSGLDHDTGPGHPERAARLEALLALFKTAPFDTLRLVEAEQAQAAWLYRAHDLDYIQQLEEAQPGSGHAYLDNDTVISPGSWEAALCAAGAACQAVADVAAGTVQRAFCAARPPGHHAEPDRAMGFCQLNNVFIAARYAQEECGIQKIAIIDFDVHHGNGTDTMTRRAEDILYISSHQFPCYPGTGDPADNIDGKILNYALPPDSGSGAFRAAYTDTILPALDAFAPELVMLSAGFDAHRADPLAQINLETEDFFWLSAELAALADRHCGGKIVSVLEGGYNLDALTMCVAAHIRALAQI